MNNIFLLMIFCGHLLGDFYFQSNDMVENKNISVIYIAKHSFLYTLSIFFTMLVFLRLNKYYIIGFITIGIIHVVIDYAKIYLLKKKENISTIHFLLDQFLHIIILVAFFIILKKNNQISPNAIGNMVKHVYHVLIDSITISMFVKYIFCFLILAKPSSVLITMIIKDLGVSKETGKQNSQTIDKNEQSFGRYIGVLERLIVFMFFSINSYASIAIVLTAKTITRFEKISKDSNFSEYYLLGTLLSLAISIFISLIML